MDNQISHDLTITGELSICGRGPLLIIVSNNYYVLSANKLVGPNTITIRRTSKVKSLSSLLHLKYALECSLYAKLFIACIAFFWKTKILEALFLYVPCHAIYKSKIYLPRIIITIGNMQSRIYRKRRGREFVKIGRTNTCYTT